jgi:hypothetical protein
MDNFNFNFKDDDYDSIPKLNDKQKKNFKIIVGILVSLLLIGIIIS